MKHLLIVLVLLSGCATASKVTIPSQCKAELSCTKEDGDRCVQFMVGIKSGACVIKIDNPGQMDLQK